MAETAVSRLLACVEPAWMALMPVELRYDGEKEFLLVAVNGPLTLDEFEAALKDITRSDQFPPNTKAIWDMREMDLSDIDRSSEERMIDIRKKHPERSSARLAFVFADDHGFVMGRMYDALAFKLSTQRRIFNSYTEAEDWLLRP